MISLKCFMVILMSIFQINGDNLDEYYLTKCTGTASSEGYYFRSDSLVVYRERVDQYEYKVQCYGRWYQIDTAFYITRGDKLEKYSLNELYSVKFLVPANLDLSNEIENLDEMISNDEDRKLLPQVAEEIEYQIVYNYFCEKPIFIVGSEQPKDIVKPSKSLRRMRDFKAASDCYLD